MEVPADLVRTGEGDPQWTQHTQSEMPFVTHPRAQAEATNVGGALWYRNGT